jgi:hypothetical protein
MLDRYRCQTSVGLVELNRVFTRHDKSFDQTTIQRPVTLSETGRHIGDMSVVPDEDSVHMGHCALQFLAAVNGLRISVGYRKSWTLELRGSTTTTPLGQD